MAKKKASTKKKATRKRTASKTKDAVRFGLPSPGLSKGPVDKAKARAVARMEKKARVAKIATSAMAGRGREAGMMMDTTSMSGGIWGSLSLDAYHTSYASGNTMYGGGVRDIPTYFIMMNQQNGGVLYWPVSLREKYEWYRYFARTDAYVGRALELLSDLPMSKLSLTVPKLKDPNLREEIHSFYTYMCERINLFQRLQEILWEYNMIGNVFAFHEWDEKRDMWSKIVLLPPEEINCFTYPFSDNARIEYRPEKLMEIIKKSREMPEALEGNEFLKQIMEHIPEDVVDMVTNQDCIVMDSDPYAGGEVGSFTNHFARRKSPYMDLGASVLERVLVPMLQKENYRYTQLALATRNMTPKNKISAPNLNNDEINELREQIDLSYMDPDYSVVTNYDWEWEMMGAESRLLDLSGEYENIENQVFAGLGVTRELLTGEGTYSGNRITVEILNTVFMLVRETLQEYVEKQLFKPVADKKGWYSEDKNGIRKYWYPRLSFNRLSIRDNQEVFENLFQLYQKGSLPIEVLFELYNLDSDTINDQIKRELFTVKDPTFNRTIENVNDEVGRQLAERSDIVEKVGKYLGLKVKPPQEEGAGGMGGEAFGEEFGAGGEGSEEDQIVEETADAVAEEMPADSTEEEVKEVVSDLSLAASEKK